jgi:ribosomal protein L40E
MTTPANDDLACPECGHLNPRKADNCWECRYDFVHDKRVVSKGAIPPKPVPPPYTVKAAVAEAPSQQPQQVSRYAFIVEFIVSTVIVGGSWVLFSWIYSGMKILPFVAGWVIALAFVKFSEGRLADPETDVREYFSLNPFEYKDNRNWHVLNWHVTLFLPRVVLHTVRRMFAVVSGAAR